MIMSFLVRTLTQKVGRKVIFKQNNVQIYLISRRNLSITPNFYDGEQDPAPMFFSDNIQILLQRLTRPNFEKIFAKKTKIGQTVLKTPIYKFLTSEELESEIAKANIKANKLLQMPPIVKVQKPINIVLSKDPALVGYDTSKYLFTDITFGVNNLHRIIVERDPDGTLKSCDHDVRKRLNQTYFPEIGRKIREPLMFSDVEKLHSLLEREKYVFVLDRACIQYEPDEPGYQKVTSITYQHVDMQQKYELLRSTRHFGPLVFYLAWHKSIDSLMLELLQTSAIREAVLLVAVRQAIHADVANAEMAEGLLQQILPKPIQLLKPDHLTTEDIEIDNKCADCIEKYILSNSSMRSQHELALQGYKEYHQQLVELSQGLQKAHGNA